MVSYPKFYKKNKIVLSLLLFFVISLIFIQNINAEPIPALRDGNVVNKDLNNSAKNLGYNTDISDVKLDIINKSIAYILSFVGLIFLINILIGGFQWMSSGGNEESIGNAKLKINHSTVGFIIVAFAYILSRLVMNLIKLF